MSEKPELVVFSIYLMGGGASFHRNMIDNRPNDNFNIKCIFLNPLHWKAKRLENLIIDENNKVFDFSSEPIKEISKRLEKLISNKEGAVLTNFQTELATLEIYRKNKKTIFFICQDDAYIHLAETYSHIIDVIIAHNIAVYNEICEMLPNRKKDIHFIQHGVTVQNFEKAINKNKKLRLVFLARHVKKKGIYDLPKIDDQLKKLDIEVDWTILGDGEERENFINEVKHRDNFNFFIPETTADIMVILKEIDLYILPSSLDGLPVSLLESMSVGCVPLVYNFSEGIKNVITIDIGFVIDKNDINTFAKKIEFLSRNRDELEKRSMACIKSIEQNFDISKQAEKYFNLYYDYKKLKKNRILNIKRFIRMYFDYKIVRKGVAFIKKIKNQL